MPLYISIPCILTMIIAATLKLLSYYNTKFKIYKLVLDIYFTSLVLLFTSMQIYEAHLTLYELNTQLNNDY